jgi:hypothetical protein
MNKLLYPILLLALMASGCTFMITTTAVSSRDAKPVPKERLLAYQEPDSKRTFPITVTRDVGILGSGCDLEFLVGDTTVGIFYQGETAKFYIEPGVSTLEANWDQKSTNALCSSSSPNFREINATKDGRTKLGLRLAIIGGRPIIGLGN